MSQPLDDLDTRLLNLIQREIPLVERPFEQLAQELSLTEGQILGRLIALKTGPSPIIRQISAIFDTTALGYRGSLVAAKVDPAHIERAAAILSLHPGVTHNYQRNHAYNLWYTIAVPPDSRFGLEKTVDILHRQSGAITTRLFPTLKLYKIGVSFDLTGETAAAARADRPGFTEAQRHAALQFTLTDADKRMIRALQQDIPLTPRPFDALAQSAGVSTDDLLTAARAYKDQSQMRRFSAVLHHRQAGFSANCMGAWAVPPDQHDRFGQLAAAFAAVSHCYLRPTFEDWPYSIFTMVHGQREPDCLATLSAISLSAGLTDYLTLFSSREFKKVRLKYFTPDIEAWEASAASFHSP